MINIPAEWLAEKLTNVEIARRLNCSATAVIYAKRRSEGKCERCGQPAAPDSRLCATHTTTVRKYHRKLHGHKPWKPGGPGRPPFSSKKKDGEQ